MSFADYHIEYLNGPIMGMLGIPFGTRPIIHTDEFDQYWPVKQFMGGSNILTKSGDGISSSKTTDQTIGHMLSIIKQDYGQAQRIAQFLDAGDLFPTLKNIYDYFFRYYQYSEDANDREQLRSPLRAYMDREKGIDCDCFVISVSSILVNLGIRHKIRRAAYEQEDSDFSHVYVIVPINDGPLNNRENYVVVDPVIHQFNYEYPADQPPLLFKDNNVKIGGLTGPFDRFRRSLPDRPDQKSNEPLISFRRGPIASDSSNPAITKTFPIIETVFPDAEANDEPEIPFFPRFDDKGRIGPGDPNRGRPPIDLRLKRDSILETSGILTFGQETTDFRFLPTFGLPFDLLPDDQQENQTASLFSFLGQGNIVRNVVIIGAGIVLISVLSSSGSKPQPVIVKKQEPPISKKHREPLKGPRKKSGGKTGKTKILSIKM